jgi:transposase
LTDHQWQQIEPHLPTDVRGKDRADDRRVISGILHVLKSGCRWKDCPPEFSRLKDFRRIATRYDKLARTYSPPSASLLLSYGEFNESRP